MPPVCHLPFVTLPHICLCPTYTHTACHPAHACSHWVLGPSHVTLPVVPHALYFVSVYFGFEHTQFAALLCTFLIHMVLRVPLLLPFILFYLPLFLCIATFTQPYCLTMLAPVIPHHTVYLLCITLFIPTVTFPTPLLLPTYLQHFTYNHYVPIYTCLVFHWVRFVGS